MKLNKLFALAALVAGGLLAGTALQAQDSTNTPPAGAPPGGRARMNPEQVAKDLGLSEDQKAKFKEAMQGQMQKMQELRKDTTLSQEDRRAKMKEIRDANNTKLKEILTPEQYDKWQKMMPGRNRAGGAGGASGPPPAASGDTAPKN